MTVQVVVTAATFLTSYAVTGTAGVGRAQLIALLASAAVAVLLARLCTRAHARSRRQKKGAPLRIRLSWRMHGATAHR